ncbi:MAG: hypothetical protein JSW18_00175 [Candidatus Omnitrophota bacterium]|nr:MAG: hypothetical protein JSW18_00175 [Candidatus Omnitrophota bacterium]
MAIRYKQLCIRCKKNYVSVTSKQRYAVCYECQMKNIDAKVKDPKMKKLLDIPEEYYRKNNFLANIKLNYLRFGKLSEKQIEVFKKVVQQMKKGS